MKIALDRYQHKGAMEAAGRGFGGAISDIKKHDDQQSDWRIGAVCNAAIEQLQSRE